MEEEMDRISFAEFKSWMNGLVVGKKGAIPDLDDWREIKKMMDRVNVDIDNEHHGCETINPYFEEGLKYEKEYDGYEQEWTRGLRSAWDGTQWGEMPEYFTTEETITTIAGDGACSAVAIPAEGFGETAAGYDTYKL